MIFLLSTQTGEQTGALSFNLARWIRNTFELPMLVGEVNDSLRKLAHIVVFFVEGILIYAALEGRTRAFLQSCGISAALSVVDEGHKFMIQGRHCHFNEMLLDAVAAAAGICLATLVRRWRHRSCGA